MNDASATAACPLALANTRLHAIESQHASAIAIAESGPARCRTSCPRP